MRGIVCVCFETGDTSCPYWDEWLTVDAEHKAIDDICRQIEMSADGGEETEYADIVEDAMSYLPYSWRFCRGIIPECHWHDVIFI